MASLIPMYSLAILGSSVFAALLAVLGSHLAARDRSMQSLCVSQGATAGTLLGIGLFQHLGEHDYGNQVYPLFFAFVGSIGTYWVSESILGLKASSRNTYFASIFAFLLSSSFLLSSIFPALEGHMAQRYFGDLATISDLEALIVLAMGVFGLGLFIGKWKSFSKGSFESAILGREVHRGSYFFGFLSIVILALSVQVLGFLFTVCCLYLPTSFGSKGVKPGLWFHFLFCTLVAALGTALGFTLSLMIGSVPTVPSIVTVMAVLGLLSTSLGSLIGFLMRVWPKPITFISFDK